MGRIRKSARMRTCTVRLPCCNGDPSTTVLAHAPSVGKGWAIKSPDWWSAFACSSCHDALDGRVKHDYTSEMILERWLKAIFETQSILCSEGLYLFPS